MSASFTWPRSWSSSPGPRLALAAGLGLGWLAPLTAPAQSAAPVEVRFPVRDSLGVLAALHGGPRGAAGPTILHFHQGGGSARGQGGGSARGEYRGITPRLLQEGSTRAGVPALTYLANEGILLRGPGGLVLIDALFGDGLPQYPAVPRPLRDSLERGLGFQGPALVLTTHAHRDHFDSAAVTRYLRSNPEARALGPPAIGAAPEALELDWVRVRALPFPHGPTVRPVGHAAYLVTLDGTTALHIGDTSSEPGSWPALGLPAGGVDLALVPYWYALDERRLSGLLQVTRARTVVLLHPPLGPAGDGLRDHGGWEAWSRGLRERFPQIRAPARPGTAVEYAE